MATAKKSPIGRSRVYNLVLVIAALSFIFWGCVIVLFPFLPALLWGIILCLTTWPAYEWLREKLQNRPTLSASLMTILLALCFIAPVLFLVNSLADHFAGAKGLVIKIIEKSAGGPPAWIADLPGVDPGAIEIGNRAEAIRTAIAELVPGDVLLVAGKGHETGQIVGDRTLPFSDHAEVRAAADRVPLDRMMIETDAPFLSPEPFRGVRPCEPKFARATAERMAEIKGLDWDTFHQAINDNTRRFFPKLQF